MFMSAGIMSVSRPLLFNGLAILLFNVLRVESSGYLQVGFFLYEFRHDSGFASLDESAQDKEDSTSSKVTSGDVIDDALTVTPWQLRSQLAGQREIGEENDSSSNTSAVPPPWSHATTCNASTSPRPQYRFLLCLDYVHSESSSQPCRLGNMEMETLSHLGALGRDIVTFPSTLGLTNNGTVTANPVVFGFERWKGAVRLRVYVACCGMPAEYEGQCEETLSYTINESPAPFAYQQLTPQNVMLRGRGRLILYLMLKCDEDYYGTYCDTQCRVDYPSVEHAFCNITTGQRQCMQGWEGPECQIDTDECRFNYCQNGAHCVDSPPGSFTCQCRLGTFGRLCETRAPICHTIPCHNGGTCHDTPYGFVCFCPVGFTGYRCERQIHVSPASNRVENVTSVREDGTEDIDNAAYSNNTTSGKSRSKTSEWEHWYTAALACAFLFVVLLVVICCLLRGRIFRYGIRAKGSFYSVFITAKTFDNVMYDDDDSDIIGSNDNNDNYPNIVHPHRNPSYKVSEVEMRVKGGASPRAVEEEGPKRYLSHLPSVRNNEREEGQYIDLINPFFPTSFSDYEGLPNLVHPHNSPFMVHRSPNRQPSPAPSRVPADGQRILSPVEHAWSDSLQIPQMVVTRHFEPLSAPCDSPDSLQDARDSPSFFAGACASPTFSMSPDSPKSFFRSRVSKKEVFTIGGTLSADSSPNGTPKPRPRKSLLGAIHGRKKPSEPKLRSIRRVDSGGYEVPAQLFRHRSAMNNHYTGLNRSRAEEHVYDEIHNQHGREVEGDAGAECLKESAVSLDAVSLGASPPADALLVVPDLPSSFTDCRESVRSEVGRYVEIDSEHFASSPCSSQKIVGGYGDEQPTWGRKLSRDEESLEMISEEQDRTLTKGTCTRDDEGRSGAVRTDTHGHDQDEPQNSEDKTGACGAQEGQSHEGTEYPEVNPTTEPDAKHVQYENLVDIAIALDQESEDDDYQDVFSDVSFDESWSDCDYTDVFTKNHAAV